MAFRVFDHNNTGKCKSTELREALMYYGEKLTEAEVRSRIRLKEQLTIYLQLVERHDYGPN
mgnify:CR=1 FL=1